MQRVAAEISFNRHTFMLTNGILAAGIGARHPSTPC